MSRFTEKEWEALHKESLEWEKKMAEAFIKKVCSEIMKEKGLTSVKNSPMVKK